MVEGFGRGADGGGFAVVVFLGVGIADSVSDAVRGCGWCA